MQWRRRRLERAITRLTARIERVEAELDVLRAQDGQLAADADDATVSAVVRPGGPTSREADRATAAHDNNRRLLDEQQATLADLRRRRDDLLDQF